MITIEQMCLPAPHAFSVEIMQRAGTEKYNTLGQRIMDGQKEKRLLNISWVRLERNVMARLFTLLDEKMLFSVTFPDPADGEKTLLCHAVGRSARVWQFPGEAAWAVVQLKLEEQ